MTETAATYRELRRSRSDRMIAGVAGGLGRYFNVNPILYRVGFVVLTLLGGAGLLIYVAAALVIPNEGDKDSLAADVLRNHRQRPVAVVGLALVAIAGIALLSHFSLHFHNDAVWVVVLVVGALLLRSRRVSPAPPPAVGNAGEDATTAVVAAPPRKRSWLGITLAVLGALTLAAVIATVVVATSYAHIGDGIGKRTYAPPTAANLHTYKLGVGNLTIDLSNTKLDGGVARVEAHLGIGALRIVVPQHATVHVLGHAVWGDIQALGHDDNGHDVNTDVGTATPQILVDAHVDVGQIQVERAPTMIP